MILLVHLIFGVALASVTPNLFLAILIALLSHYFLDAIPHIEYVKYKLGDTKLSIIKNSKIIILQVILDVLIGILLAVIFTGISYKFFWAGFFAILPDTIFVIGLFWPNKFLDWHEMLDKKIHFLYNNKYFNVFWRIFFQVLIVIISILILQR